MSKSLIRQELIRQLKAVLDDFRTKECSCDGEYEDGRLVGHACYFHRNEEELKRVIEKLEEGSREK